MAKRLRSDPIAMTLSSGTSTTTGTTFGFLALHKAPFEPGANDDRYTITHLPTGHYLRNVRTLAEGEMYIDALLALEGIAWEALTDDDLATIYAVCFPAPVRMPAATAATLEPLYVSPVARLASPALRADSRRLARLATEWWTSPTPGAGEALRGALAASHDLEYRELIMARFVTGKHQQLTEEDVPRTHPIAPYELGTQATAQSFRYLMALGDEVDRHCDIDLDTLTDEEFDVWDTTLNGLVISGWQRWSVTVSQFISCDDATQLRYTRHLGFLGSPRTGWHMLGKKTFLRTEKLAALLPTRRMRRAALKEARYEWAPRNHPAPAPLD